jgi:hypothetical protein
VPIGPAPWKHEAPTLFGGVTLSRPQHGFAPRLVAVLLVLQLLAGVSVCQSREGSAGHDAAAAVQEDARPHESEDGAAGRHQHADSGHHECPETFLTPRCHAMPLLAGQEQVRVAPIAAAPSPDYDIPPPIPIV